nr:hypothetical protein CFP56_32958 [Quercus suber]
MGPNGKYVVKWADMEELSPMSDVEPTSGLSSSLGFHISLSDNQDNFEKEKALIAVEETPKYGEGWYNMEEGRAYDTDNNSSVPSLCKNVTVGPNPKLALTGLDGEEPIWVKPLMVSIPEANLSFEENGIGQIGSFENVQRNRGKDL